MSEAEFQESQFNQPDELSKDGDGGGGTLSMPPIIVHVSVVDPDNLERAQQAAIRLTQVVARELQRLEGADLSATVTVLGRTYQLADVLIDLYNTEFTVTDRTDFDNNGVGASSRGMLGEPNTDIINMDAILDAYGSPNYPNDIGMTVLIFHEMAHISEIGTDFFNESVQFYNSEPADKRGEFYAKPNGSEYSQNIEAFANDFKNALHNIFGIDQGPNPGGFTNAREPSEIYQERMNGYSS